MKTTAMAAEERVRYMTQAPVRRLILEMSAPTVISMLVTSFYNMADTLFVGQLDTQSTAAVGVAYSAMALLQATSFFFGHGSGNYISRQLGARNYEAAASQRWAWRSLRRSPGCWALRQQFCPTRSPTCGSSFWVRRF